MAKKLKDLIFNEAVSFEDEDVRYDTSDKKAFLEQCKQFSAHGESIYRTKDLVERVREIKDLVDTAEKMTVQETENWFDNVTVQRHLKQLKEAYKTFEKTASEIVSSQQRLEASYEDIGEILNKYYEVS